MSGFSADWLALREPADHAARSLTVTDAVLRAAARGEGPTHIVDLGCGTGSNMRFLAPRLRTAATWCLVDNDEALLTIVRRALADRSRALSADLLHLDPALIAGAHMATASALLDLVSDIWLEQLVRECRRAAANVLFALNFDGRILCSPADDDDRFVQELVLTHQRTDKGFGPALGPDASNRVTALLEGAGYQVRVARSDWVLGDQSAELQRQLVAGWAEAAAELSPADHARIHSWHRRRRDHVNRGASEIIVGHQDVGGTIGGEGGAEV